MGLGPIFDDRRAQRECREMESKGLFGSAGWCYHIRKLGWLLEALPPEAALRALLHQGKVGFIAFDSFGQAEPALDLALFLAGTKNIGLSEPHEEESNED